MFNLIKQVFIVLNISISCARGGTKCTGSCNVLSPNIRIPKETKNIYVKALNVIANKNVAKAMTEHISCDCKYKSNSTTCNS